MSRVWLLLAAFIGSATAISYVTDDIPNDRIFNGTQAEVQEFPFMVSITYGNAHRCGGFIYNERHVITAASCFDELNAGNLVNNVTGLYVYAAQLSLISPDPGEQIIPVEWVKIFDGYNNRTKLHDIALVQIVKPFVFAADNVTWIKFEEINDLGSPTATIMGWGALTEGGLAYTRLRKAVVSVLGTDCRTYGSDEYNINYMLCVGNTTDSSTPCPYDEGGPLVQDDIAIGIFSKISKCGTPPGIYTRIAPYYPWIFKFAGQQPA